MKLLILAQKRSGSHYLQQSIGCAALSGTTFVQKMEAGGTYSEDWLQKEKALRPDVQMLRFHNFSTRNWHYVQFYALAQKLIDDAIDIVVLRRQSLFLHALSDYYNNNHFVREKKLELPWDQWVAYRQDIVDTTAVPVKKFLIAMQRVHQFYTFFDTLLAEQSPAEFYYENFTNIGIGDVVNYINMLTQIEPKLEIIKPIQWRAVDYERCPNFTDLTQAYKDNKR